MLNKLGQLDHEIIKDKVICTCSLGFGWVDTPRSNAFGLGLNSDQDSKNPYSFKTDYKLFVNFEQGRAAQSRETMNEAFRRLCKH